MPRSPRILVAALLALSPFRDARALEILHVSHAPEMFEPRKNESAQVRFHLSDPARVTLHVYDGRERLIRSVSTGKTLIAGDQRMSWDGRDTEGRAVPPEAYTYALEAVGTDGKSASWDIADFAGEPIDIAGAEWRADRRRLAYSLSKLARVRLRIGLADNGPLLRTLVDWVPRLPGTHEEPWDGRDATGTVDLAKHPSLHLDVSAFALPRNTILIGPPPAESAFLNLSSDVPRRAARPRKTHRMFDYGHQSAEERRDFRVDLVLPSDLKRNRDGIPIVRTSIPVRVQVSDDALARVQDERSEAVFFVDGHFLFERETGFLPMTWDWDPSGHASGLHYLTTNIRGYEGHFGVGTVPVWVELDHESKSR
jgi:hypothetical protein